jgi:hypothetical protein
VYQFTIAFLGAKFVGEQLVNCPSIISPNSLVMDLWFLQQRVLIENNAQD